MTYPRASVCFFAAFFVSMVLSPLVFGQRGNPQATIVPTLVNFSGVLTGGDAKPLTTLTGVTFALYAEQQGGAPLWLETQNMQPDHTGHYSVILGSATSGGVPASLFANGQARWLEVQAQGQEPQPRIMLMSVPYALKAGDAQTLGGLPASAFLTQHPTAFASGARSNVVASGTKTKPPVGGTGTQGYVSLWTDNNGDLGNSSIFQTGSGTSAKIGINTTKPDAPLDVKGRINATLGYNFNGKPFAFGSYSNQNAFVGFAGNTTTTGGFNTGSGWEALFNNTTGGDNVANGTEALLLNTTGSDNTAVGAQALQGNSTGTGNTATGAYAMILNTTGISNTANGYRALYGNRTGGANTATGTGALYYNQVGNYNSAFGQGALYNATSSYNTAIGGLALNFDTTGNLNTATGWQALYSNTTGYTNTASGIQTLYSNTTGYDNTATGDSALLENITGNQNTGIGSYALYGNSTGGNNTAIGYEAAYSNMTGYDNTATGYNANYANEFGGANTAEGAEALMNNQGGSDNTAVGFQALYSSTSGSFLTCVGYDCNTGENGLSNATAIGAHAVVSQNNSLVLGGTGKWAVKVGIGTTRPSNILTVGQGAGHPVSDSWETYSSRRWKTNIQPLQNALGTVEQLRGVSYDMKDSGRHEIGVIAEEVGAVVPELVTFEPNGTDARSMDYSRLTALLIEAAKEQQALIGQLQRQIRARQTQMKAQQRQIARLNSQVKAIQASLKTNRGTDSEIRIVKAQIPTVKQ